MTTTDTMTGTTADAGGPEARPGPAVAGFPGGDDHLEALDDAVGEILGRSPADADTPTGRRALWDALEGAGFTLLSLPEEHGGSGGNLADAVTVLRRCAYAGVRLPLLETLLAGWCCASAGVTIPAGPLAFATAGRDATAVRMPWAPFADHLVVLSGGGTPALTVTDRRETVVRETDDGSLTGEPVGEVRPTNPPAPAEAASSAPPTADQARLRGALLRSAELHGAVAAALDQAVRHSGEREQFGRALHRF
ncbi:MAG TPA: acyl-CoA dehydrogenase family protein, partial [Streptomyces sp.]|nr:acyl-CoA dehydrogenase family protein [Streptomyces sp.]